MNYTWNFSSIIHYRDVLYHGFVNTVLLALVSIFSALVVGVFLALLRTGRISLLRVPAAIYVNFFRNIPFIVQLFWFFYAIPVMTSFQASPFFAAYFALTLYGGAYFAEILRAGLEGIAYGQWEAAKAIGLGYRRTMTDVILPQAIRRIIPPLTTEVIEMVKLTTIASSIAFGELLYAGKLVADQDFRPLEAYTAVAVVLIVLLCFLSGIGSWVERRLAIGVRPVKSR
ncbi:polar amino acid transport system permease protein [Burkholderia sp. GAS332]|nr:polar amino acid transport system permease protein [Burkholderia sp. GAS332]